jgi:hypothetical protein
MSIRPSRDLHASRVPDIIDYFARQTGVREEDVQKLLGVPRFQAAAHAFAFQRISLGYAAFFCWDDAINAINDSTAQSLVDLIRHVSRRMELGNADSRHIPVDGQEMLERYPELYWKNNIDEHKLFDARFKREMVGFDRVAPWKNTVQPFFGTMEEFEYVSFWLDHSPDQISALLAHPNFSIHFDKFKSRHFLYPEFVQAIYSDRNHILFPELGWHLSTLAFAELSKRASRGELRPFLSGDIPQ